MRSTAQLKTAVEDAIRGEAQALGQLSHAIHGLPELAFEEHRAASAIQAFLEERSVVVERPAYGLDTALCAQTGSGASVVAICAEYDALPVLGHACGHNIIAAAAVGAFLGLAAISADLKIAARLLGTPAEEAGNGAGKVLMLERGAFDDVVAAMMVHPGPFDVLRPLMIAAAQLDVVYTGRESHAAFYPELGVNAADALTIAQVALAFLRQSLTARERLHGIVTEGGTAPNIIPAKAVGRFMVRAHTSVELEPLLKKVIACFEAGALATGAELRVVGGDRPYAHVAHNHVLAETFRRNAERLGRVFDAVGAEDRPSGSTDMGNVSLHVPTIHPFLGIQSWPAVNHQPDFATHCVTPHADEAVIDGAIAMAWSAVDIAAAENAGGWLLGDGEEA